MKTISMVDATLRKKCFRLCADPSSGNHPRVTQPKNKNRNLKTERKIC